MLFTFNNSNNKTDRESYKKYFRYCIQSYSKKRKQLKSLCKKLANSVKESQKRNSKQKLSNTHLLYKHRKLFPVELTMTSVSLIH